MYQYQQPYQQPYQQSYQQPRTGIAGRIVSSVEEVTANEVPMDGSIALFPLQDHSAIYGKVWNTNGTISTMRYEPIEKVEPSATLDDVIEQLSTIAGLLKPKTRTKKESDE